MTTPHHDVAALLGRPAEELVELDRRPLVFAFVDGRYEQVVLRVRGTREVFEVTVATDGRLVDVEELIARNRAVAAERAAVLDEALAGLLLRHPELEAIHVRYTRAGAADEHPHPVTAVLSAPDIADLAGDPTVTRIVLQDDPVILDRD